MIKITADIDQVFSIIFKNTSTKSITSWLFEDLESFQKGRESLENMHWVEILSETNAIVKRKNDF